VNAPVSLPEPALNLPGVSFQEHVIWRLNRWGLFVMWQERKQRVSRVGNSGIHIGRSVTTYRAVMPKHVTSWWGYLILDRNVAPNNTWDDRAGMCPVSEEEAGVTAEAVSRLPPDLRDVITLEHICRGTLEKKAEMMGVSRRTYCRMCQRGYTLLLGLILDVEAGL
jgi:hypothetical protein